MTGNDLEQKIQDVLYPISQEKKLGDFFNQNYPNQWQKIPQKEKDSLISTFIKYLNNPSNIKEVEDLIKKSENFENKKSDIIILFLGVLLGVSGNLIANLLDKYFSYFGCFYNISVIIIFLLSSWSIYNFFIRKTTKEIKDKENSIELLKMIERVENYK